MDAAVPDHLHFIWIGQRLPWFAQLALRTANRACPHARITLWTADTLVEDDGLSALKRTGRVEIARLDERSLFADAPGELPLELLARLFAGLTAPAARANLARLLILLRHGGVYLDTDTVTLRDLSPLRREGAFCGLEHVVWPLELRQQIGPYRVLGGPLRGFVRRVCARVPRGDLLFARAARFYSQAANNAVLGFPAAHPFLLAMLRRVDALSEAERHVRYRLGTHLLQECLRMHGDALSVRRLAPHHFYPLGPEISRQYFRKRRDVEAAARQIAGEQTYVVHWYASVSELAHYDETLMLAQRSSTLFGQLSASALGYT